MAMQQYHLHSQKHGVIFKTLCVGGGDPGMDQNLDQALKKKMDGTREEVVAEEERR